MVQERTQEALAAHLLGREAVEDLAGSVVHGVQVARSGRAGTAGGVAAADGVLLGALEARLADPHADGVGVSLALLDAGEAVDGVDDGLSSTLDLVA